MDPLMALGHPQIGILIVAAQVRYLWDRWTEKDSKDEGRHSP
jgi:hypothetical protein